MQKIEYKLQKFWITISFYRYRGDRKNYPDNNIKLIDYYNDKMYDCMDIFIIYDKTTGYWTVNNFYSSGSNPRDNMRLLDTDIYKKVNETTQHVIKNYRYFMNVRVENSFVISHYYTTDWDSTIEWNRYVTHTRFVKNVHENEIKEILDHCLYSVKVPTFLIIDQIDYHNELTKVCDYR